jgi:hypothetical protein
MKTILTAFRLISFSLISFNLTFLCSCHQNPPAKIDLSGVWQFAMDPADEGIKAQWYKKTLKDQIILPGSMASGKGTMSL